jgi:hypothetical protein
MNSEMDRMWKEPAVIWFEALCLHLLSQTEDNGEFLSEIFDPLAQIVTRCLLKSLAGRETDYELEGRGSISHTGKNSSLHHSVQNGGRVHLTSYPKGLEAIFLWRKQPGREADRLLPCIMEVKNSRTRHSTRHASS